MSNDDGTPPPGWQSTMPGDRPAGDVLAKLDEIAPIIGLQSRLALVFNLRLEEAMRLKPYICDQVTHLNIVAGTKGGRPRTAPIDHPIKRSLLDQAKTLASCPEHSTIPRTHSLASWRSHFNYVLKKAGVTRDNFRASAPSLGG